MGHFRAQNQHIWSFFYICSLVFSEVCLWWQAVKKWVKVAVWIFKKWDIIRLKNVKMQKFHKIHEKFHKMLRDDMLSKGSKSDFHFLEQIWLCSENFILDIFWGQVSFFLFNCFVFPDSFSAKTRGSLLPRTFFLVCPEFAVR